MNIKNKLTRKEALELVRRIPAIMWREDKAEFSDCEFVLHAEVWGMHLDVTSFGVDSSGKDLGYRMRGRVHLGGYAHRNLFSYSGKDLEKVYDRLHDKYFEGRVNAQKALEFLESGKFSQSLIDKIKTVIHKRGVPK